MVEQGADAQPPAAGLQLQSADLCDCLFYTTYNYFV